MPSRKSRGRISTLASSWIGWPSSSTVKVTSTALPSRSSEDTLPTLTPAIRTGEVGRRVAAFSNVACSWKPSLVNGIFFANAR